MSAYGQKILHQALKLRPIERAELVENILSSFEFTERKKIDDLWSKEAEERITAFEAGKIKAVPLKSLFKKIDR